MICYDFLYTISHLIMHYMPCMFLGLEITSYIKTVQLNTGYNFTEVYFSHSLHNPPPILKQYSSTLDIMSLRCTFPSSYIKTVQLNLLYNFTEVYFSHSLNNPPPILKQYSSTLDIISLMCTQPHSLHKPPPKLKLHSSTLDIISLRCTSPIHYITLLLY